MFGALMDSYSSIADALMENLVCLVLFHLFAVLAALTMMNMLLGILCEVINAVAASEKEALELGAMKETVGHIFHELDTSGTDVLSQKEFSKIIENPSARQIIDKLGIDMEQVIDTIEDMFMGDNEGGALSPGDFMDILLQMRGSNYATVKDLMSQTKVLKKVIQENSPMWGNPNHESTYSINSQSISVLRQTGREENGSCARGSLHESEIRSVEAVHHPLAVDSLE